MHRECVPRSIWVTAGIGIAALAVYSALAQDTLYGHDGAFILSRLLERGGPGRDRHLYAPLLNGLHDLLQAFWPVRGIRTGALLSAIGTAIGVMFVHRAALWLGLPPVRAAWAALLFAFAPPVVFFATVVENHGPFTIVIGASLWAAVIAGGAARASRRIAAAVVAGLAIGLGYALHPTAWLLPVLLLPLIHVRGLEVGAERWRPIAAAAVTFVVAAVSYTPLVRALGVVHEPHSFGTVLVQSLPHLIWMPAILWHEWLLPHAPMSIVVVVLAIDAMRRRRANALRWHAVLGCGLVVLLACTAMTLGDGIRERGAYLIPVASVAAVVVAGALSPRLTATLVVASFVVAVVEVRVHDRGARFYGDFVRGVEAASAPSTPLVLVAVVEEIAACTLASESTALRSIDVYPHTRVAPEAVDAMQPHFRGALREAARGRVVLISRRSVERVRTATEAGRRLIEGLEASVRFEPQRFHGFDGFRLVCD